MHRSIAFLAVVFCASAALAQEDAKTSPYATFTGRDIKSLSPEQVKALTDGAGMGLALPAELNGFPGPKHVIELADTLELSADQRQQVAGIEKKMRENATKIGAEILRFERSLNEAFAGEEIDRDSLYEMTDRIGVLQGRLRFAHLLAHIETHAVLTAAQRKAYDEARGYAAPEHPHRLHGH